MGRSTRKAALNMQANDHDFDMEDYVPDAQYGQKQAETTTEVKQNGKAYNPNEQPANVDVPRNESFSGNMAGKM